MALKSFNHIGKGRDLTPEEQGEFYDRMKCSVWLLKVGVGSNLKVASGVCINETGHILSSSSIIGKNDTVQGREVSSTRFQDLKIIKHGDNLVILQPIHKKKEGYDHAAVADESTTFTDCQQIYCIFHEDLGIYSFAVGEISHRKRVVNGIHHFQVSNVHRNDASAIVFSSTGHVIGMVVQTSCPIDENPHNLALPFSEINSFLKSLKPAGSKPRKG